MSQRKPVNTKKEQNAEDNVSRLEQPAGGDCSCSTPGALEISGPIYLREDPEPYCQGFEEYQ